DTRRRSRSGRPTLPWWCAILRPMPAAPVPPGRRPGLRAGEFDVRVSPVDPAEIAAFPVRVDRPHEVQVLRHRLLVQPGCLDRIGAVTEILDLVHLSISDRVQHEEMNDDRDAALSASSTLANESHDATIRHLDYFKQLLDEVARLFAASNRSRASSSASRV